MANGLLPGMGELAEEGKRILCSNCHRRLAPPHKKLCSKCRVQASKNQENKRRNGLCMRCGKAKSEGNRFCKDCKTKYNEWQRIRRERFKNSGLCSNCGQVPPEDNKKYCHECTIQNKQKSNFRKRNKLCYRCGKPRAENSSYCEEHKNQFRERSRKDWASSLIRSIFSKHKHELKGRGLGESDLTAEFLRSLFDNQQGRCYWFGIPMVSHLESKHPQLPSLDRIDGKKGYTKDNVLLTCLATNLGRNNSSPETFRAFCDLLKATYAAGDQAAAWSVLFRR